MAGGWTSPLIRGCTAPRWDRMDLRSKRQISTNQRGGTKRLAWWLRGDLVIPSRVVAHRCMTRAIHDPNAKRRVPKRSRNQPTGDPQGDVEKPLRAWFFPLLFHQGSDGWVGVSRSRPPRTPSCGYPNEPIIPAEDFPIPYVTFLVSTRPDLRILFDRVHPPPHAQRTFPSPSLLLPSVLCAVRPSPWCFSSIRSGSIGQAGSRPGFRLVEVDFQGDGRGTWTISPSTTRRVQFRVSFANSPRASSDLLHPSTERRPWLPPPSYSKLWPRPSASTRSPR